MNEGRWKAKINKLIRQQGTYVWSISDRLSAGIPDTYYSGDRGTLVVEYKYQHDEKERIPALTQLQHKWLYNRQMEGRRVLVVLATPTEVRVYEDMTDLTQPTHRETQADYIRRIVEACGQSNSITPPPLPKLSLSSNKSPSRNTQSPVPHSPSTRSRSSKTVTAGS